MYLQIFSKRSRSWAFVARGDVDTSRLLAQNLKSKIDQRFLV